MIAITQKVKILLKALIAIASLLLFYFVTVSAISGWKFALFQFSNYWYFLISLALGFGMQIGLYSYLKQLAKNSSTAIEGAVAVTGTTSTLAMISCCAHYLANIVPMLGIAGVLSLAAQYQVKIFWIGLAFNLFGIAFITDKIITFKRHL